VEIDDDAAESYRLNVGLKPVTRDIRKVSGTELLQAAGLAPGQCTVAVGCPPCQSYTVLRRGSPAVAADKERDGLAREFLRLVGEIRPRHVVFENVPGMAVGNGRTEFFGVVEGLKKLGYSSKWATVDAADFGVPQHRRRLILLGSRVSAPSLPTPTHGPGQDSGLKPYVTVQDAIGSLEPPPADGEKGSDPLHMARCHSELVLRRLHAIPVGGGRTDLPKELELDCHRGHKGHYDVYGRMRWDRPSPTITSGCTNVTRGRFAHPDQDRAITLREAMLLQSFPPTATIAGKGDSRPQQVGNAVPTILAERIADAVVSMEESSRGLIEAT
jgi:DNA (cytosine-5)-methyltransferase 1